MSFTVVDRIMSLNMVTTKSQRWEIGAAVRERYRDLHGQLPDKELRQKTNGSGGSHCFAVYPDSFMPEADAIIKSRQLQASRQGSLFP